MLQMLQYQQLLRIILSTIILFFNYWEVIDIRKIVRMVVLLVISGATSMACGTILEVENSHATFLHLNGGPLLDIDPPFPNGENGWYITPPMITINFSIPSHTLSYCIDHGVWQTYTGPFTLDWLDGYHSFEALAITSAGEIYDIIEFKLDTTPPLIDVYDPIFVTISPIVVQTNTHNETSGINRVEFFLDDELSYTDTDEPYKWTIDRDNYSSGLHTAKAIAFDNAGNNASEEFTIRIIKSKTIYQLLSEVLDKLMDQFFLR